MSELPPEHASFDHDRLADLADEFARRYRRGERPSVEEYARQHPALAAQIRELFPAMLVMEQSSEAAAPQVAPPSERVGAVIGPYKLLERLGEGGFGTVFMAEQQHPVRRKVALKLVKPGVDTGRVIARFEAERQALALMEHPNIAKVFDAGATDAGRPYFVMELVKGVPITTYCDDLRLTPEQRLELFVPVCQAVQHAHQKGVIHRDLKPSNVLVALYDGRPVPKVIDFGVAKATGEALTERTLFTGFGEMVGTLQYMSPEQAELNQLDVDTRSDVYALGVLLYELLTGTTPLEAARLKRAALLEALRVIREEEPPRPSTRLSTSDALPTVAANRGLEPKRLSGLVRGELDWIVMKALEKDRTRRYATAAGFAADVERYLSDEPVQAGPPSAWYRGRKFARRNRAALTITAVAVCALIGAVVMQDRNNRRLAREQANTLAALEKTEVARRRAREAFDHLSSDIIGDWLSRQAALTDQQKQVLELALSRYEQFAAEAQDAPDERFAMARAYWRVADFRAQLGMRRESDAAFARGIEVYGSLAAQFPGEPKYASELAKIHINQSAALQRVAAWDESMASCEAARGVLEPLTARYPDAPEYAIDLAGAYCNIAHMVRDKDAAGALPWYDRAIARLEPLRHRPEPALRYANMFLSNALRGRAGALEDLGRLDEAVAAHETARALREQMVAQSPDPQYARELGESHKSMALVLAKLGRTSEATNAFEAAIAVLGELVTDHPGLPQFIDDLAAAHADMAAMQMKLGRPSDARWSYEASRELRERLSRANPGKAEHAIRLGGAECNLAGAIKASGHAAGSLEPYQRAIDTLTPIAQKESPPGRAQWFLRNSYSGRADAMGKLGRYTEALDDLDRTIALDDRANPSYRVRRAAVLAHLGRHADAAATIDEVAAIKELSADVAYDAACASSLCVAAVVNDARLSVADDQDLVEAYSARAVVLLHRAVKSGYADLQRLKTDTDLEPLRQRNDFKKLIVEAEATAKATTRPNSRER